MIVQSLFAKVAPKLKSSRPHGLRCREHVILFGIICLTSSAFGQTTRTNPSASSTTPTLPFSSTGPNVPCGPFNPTSPCYATRTPHNPCYSALSPNQPCSTTTTPYPQTSPTPNPKSRPVAVHAITLDQAKAQIEAKGYSDIVGLRRDREGIWHGKAEKDGLPREVILDRMGNLAEQ